MKYQNSENCDFIVFGSTYPTPGIAMMEAIACPFFIIKIKLLNNANWNKSVRLYFAEAARNWSNVNAAWSNSSTWAITPGWFYIARFDNSFEWSIPADVENT